MAGLGRFLMAVDRLREAEVWLRRAADLGEPAAFFYLGTLLEQRDDLSDAIEWYRRAADTGDEEALTVLRRLGGVDDPVTAFGRTAAEPAT
jgi:TPR repeat protein